MKPCTQCGRCCTHAGFMNSMQASRADVLRWKKEKRDDILQYAYVYGWKKGSLGEKYAFPFADLWISPRTDEPMDRCPFVRKIRGTDRYACRIYETRPQACREYPYNVGHMQTVDCEMLDPGDTDADVARFMEREVPS